MSFLFSLVYDKVMQRTEEACLADWRQELLQHVQGRVLEIGAGTGASLGLYPPNPELELVLSEPDENMRRRLQERVSQHPEKRLTVLDCPAESIHSEDGSFDFVFASLVCCSVSNVAQTLGEIRRILKPGGAFIFVEHVAAEAGSARQWWQNTLNPVWKRLAGNCHLNRDTEAEIRDAGFVIESIRYESMRKAIPLVRPTIRGIARKP